MNICVIPARGGSKRIPRKNIRDFCGKPMIAWSIAAALQSGCFDQVFVSTDDLEIAELSSSLGADIPFIRPSELSSDHATTRDVIHHAVSWMSENQIIAKHLCCLYATAPFVQVDDLRHAQNLLSNVRPNTFIFSATSFPFPIQRALKLDSDGYGSMFYPAYSDIRSQDLQEAFHDAGQFYWATPSTWLSEHNIFQNSRPLLIPRWRVQDIDTEEDWLRAEILYQILQKGV